MPADNALNSHSNGPPDIISSGQSMGIGVSSAERPGGVMRDRPEAVGAYSASREGKRLNMLGFNNNQTTATNYNATGHNHLLDGSNAASNSIGVPNSTNDRDHRDLSGLMGAYGSGHHGAGPPGYGGQAAASVVGGRDNNNGTAGGVLSQSGVSHSALVNSGNAAILGHSSFKLGNTSNTNNLNNNMAAGNGGGGPVTLGSTYGALGTSNGLHHQPPQLSRDNIF